jgi:hypothetical protein
MLFESVMLREEETHVNDVDIDLIDCVCIARGVLLRY